jgi:phospholipid-binding lipoprotein MlaA
MSRRRNALPTQQRAAAPFLTPHAGALLLLTLLLGLSGCATIPGGKPDPRDRFERFNRTVFVFNTKLDHAVLRPAARGYVKLIPRPVRTGVNNFITNLNSPVTIVNNFLQGKISDAINDTARLVVNTTIGIGGLFDPATGMGLDRHLADFGETLGIWGVHGGPYLMLPFLGSSNVRDAIGLVPDYLLLHEIETVKLFDNNEYVEWSLYAVEVVNRRAQLLDLDSVLDSSYDPYAVLRSAYLQRRAYLINGGVTPPEEEFPDADMDSGDAAPAAPAEPAAPPAPGAAPPSAPPVSSPPAPPAPPPPK